MSRSSPQVGEPLTLTMRVRDFYSRLVSAFVDDGVDDVAAMMTYYAIFALFPMMLCILSLTLLVLPPSVVTEATAMIGSPLPREIDQLLRAQIAQAQAATDGNVALIGGLLALWGASRGTSALTVALNRVFSKQETRPWWRRQLLAIVVTALVAVLIVIALSFLVLGPAIGHAVADRYQLGASFDAAWTIARWIGAGALMTFVWALLYKLLPASDAPLRIFTPGAAVGVLLWIGVSQAVSFVVTYLADFEATYGALAGAVTFLLWLWLSNLALLVGAEISEVIHRRDIRPSPLPSAQTITA